MIIPHNKYIAKAILGTLRDNSLEEKKRIFADLSWELAGKFVPEELETLDSAHGNKNSIAQLDLETLFKFRDLQTNFNNRWELLETLMVEYIKLSNKSLSNDDADEIAGGSYEALVMYSQASTDEIEGAFRLFFARIK